MDDTEFEELLRPGLGVDPGRAVPVLYRDQLLTMTPQQLDRVYEQTRAGELRISRTAASPEAARARASLRHFIRQVSPWFRINRCQAYLIQILQQFVEATERDEEPREEISWPPRHSKALALDTPIPTPNGWTTMGALRVGDMVFDAEGLPTRVLAKSSVFRNRPCWRVEANSGDFLIADEDHEFPVILDRKKPKVRLKTAGFLGRRTSPRAARLVRARPLQLPEIDLPIEPYALGVWLGDGTSSDGTITGSEVKTPWIQAEFSRRGMDSHTTPANPHSIRVAGLRQTLRRLGLLRNKHVPAQYFRASESQRRALLQGLIDTDGHVMSDGQVFFTNTRQALADAVRELVASLGCKSSIAERRATLNGKDCGPYWQVNFYMAGAALMPTKAAGCRNSSRTPDHYLKATPAEPQDTQCIQVDSPSHMFLAGRGMFPSHNSSLVYHSVAWAMGRNPDWPVIYASHSASKAEEYSRHIRDMMETDTYQGIFQGVRCNPAAGEVANWKLLHHRGELTARGVGGKLKGYGAKLCIIDDPVGDANDADNPDFREKQRNWYSGNLYNRLHKGAGVALVMQRVHHEDLAGYVLTGAGSELPPAERWRETRFPALATENDVMGRKPGEALWPEEFPRARLLVMKAQMSAMSARIWEAQYQQNPLPLGGNLLASYRIQNKPPPPLAELRVYQAWDLAISKKKRSDWRCCATVGIDGDGMIHILNMRRNRDGFNATLAQMYDQWAAWKPLAIGIEMAGYQEAAFEEVNRRYGLLPFIEIRDNRPKDVRAILLSTRIDAGKVCADKNQPWWEWTEREFLEFPGSEHDDAVDSAAHCVTLAAQVFAGWASDGDGLRELLRQCEDGYPDRPDLVPDEPAVLDVLFTCEEPSAADRALRAIGSFVVSTTGNRYLLHEGCHVARLYGATRAGQAALAKLPAVQVVRALPRPLS